MRTGTLLCPVNVEVTSPLSLSMAIVYDILMQSIAIPSSSYISLVLNHAAMVNKTGCQFLCYPSHAPSRVVDATIVSIAEDHASVDHGCERCAYLYKQWGPVFRGLKSMM